MDKGIRHDNVLQTEEEKNGPMRRAVLANQWECVDSDGPAQERADQQHMYPHQNRCVLSLKENTVSLVGGDGEDEDPTDDETGCLYDSLEVVAHCHAKRSPTMLPTEYVDTQTAESEGISLSDDVYSDLRYDPNWRTKLTGAGHFSQSPQISIKEYCEVNSDQPYYLHSRDDQNGSVIPPQFKTYNQQKLRQTQGESTQMQHISSPTFSRPKVSSKKKHERPKLDIVEHNKLTLGRNTNSCGSYMSVHALQQDTSDNGNEVTQISRGKAQRKNDPKKAQWKEHPNTSKNEQHPASRVRAKPGDCQLARPAAVTQSKPQTHRLHHNINLSTSSHVFPVLQPNGQDVMVDMASLHASPQWSIASEVDLALSSGYQQTNSGESSLVSEKGLKAQVHHGNLESITEQSTTATQWPLSCEEENQTWSPVLTGTPTTTSSVVSSTYTVLPPIGEPMTGKQLELSRVKSVNTANPIRGTPSRCDGYLVQMEKQRQPGAKVTYKTYNLTDYKQLNSDVKLQGLGPDYKAIEKTKMRRQRLYSDMIRKQNKKISRIPFLPAKDQEGKDKNVPRMKALEYAKTITKPSAQSQPKQRPKQQSDTEHSPVLEGLDVAQTDTLEELRKRYEEEKKAGALLGKVHAVRGKVRVKLGDTLRTQQVVSIE